MLPHELPTVVRQLFDEVAGLGDPKQRAAALRILDHAYAMERRRLMAAVAFDLRRAGVDADQVAGLLGIERHFATRLIREHAQATGREVPRQVHRRGPIEAITITD